MKNKKVKTGYTLLEVLLYTAVSAVLLFSISTLTFSLVQSRDRTQVLTEVDETGMQIINQIAQTIRNSNSITSPTSGTNATSLTIVVDDSLKSPTIYDLSSSYIRVKEGTATTVNLNSNRILISNLNFYNYSRNSTKGSIRFQFRATYNNTSGRTVYNYYRDFTATATLK